MDTWILNHETPLAIISDRGTEFLNDLHTTLNALLGIKGLYTTSYHPRGNPAERIHQMFKGAVKRAFDVGGGTG